MTGAANGIGFAIAARLARDGARLVIADLDEAGLEKAKQRLDGAVENVAGDLALEPVATATIDRAISAFGRATSSLTMPAGASYVRSPITPRKP